MASNSNRRGLRPPGSPNSSRRGLRAPGSPDSGRLKITLERSTIGCSSNQRENIRGLGLRKVGQSRTLENTPAVRGMVKKVLHLVTVEELTAGSGG